MSWNQHGVFAQAPPGASGLPQMPQGQQTLPPQQGYQGGYSIDHLPPPPGQQQTAPPNPYGVQPGVPGAQIAQPLRTSAPQQQWGTPQQAQGAPAQQQWPQGQPAQQVPYGQPQQQWPQGQPAQQTQGNRVQLDDHAILDGPGVPPELRGRTWADARRLYSALSVDWLQRNSRQQTPAQQTLQSQGFPQQPYGQQGQQPQQDSRTFWQNPDQRIAEVVQNTVGQMLQPVIAQTQSQAILQARQIAQIGIQDFNYLEPDIMQIVSQARPEDLQNPQVWIAAARMARGQRMESGQYDFNAARRLSQQAPQVPGQNGNGQYGPGAAVPAYQAPPVYQFFSESPTAPNVGFGGPSGGGRQPTQEEYQQAQKFQMSIQDFMAWKYGVGEQQMVGSF